MPHHTAISKSWAKWALQERRRRRIMQLNAASQCPECLSSETSVYHRDKSGMLGFVCWSCGCKFDELGSVIWGKEKEAQG